MQRRIHLVTFGCQMNKLDSELMEQILGAAGHEIVADNKSADTVIFSTCSVREQAENRVLSALGALNQRKRDGAKITVCVTGCMAQRLGKKLVSQYKADVVIGTRQFHRINELLDAAENEPVVEISEAPSNSQTNTASATASNAAPALPLHRHHGGAQGYISAMRGCDNYCAYCIVPYVRGREESRPVAEIVAEAKGLVDAGAKEITLLGQSINSFGHDLAPKSTLAELLRAVAEIPGLVRLRFLTSHPKDATEALFRAIADTPKVCEYLHLPAQSGSTRVLAAMNRGYTREHYDALLAQGQDIVKGLAFASDFIVGFPGETEADFLATLDLVEKTKFQNIFAFRYSPRPGTKAASLPDDVPQAEKERRLQALLHAQERIGAERNRRMAESGEAVTILVEGASKKDKAKLAGRTPQSAMVMVPAPEDADAAAQLAGAEVKVRITGHTPLTLFGEII